MQTPDWATMESKRIFTNGDRILFVIAALIVLSLPLVILASHNQVRNKSYAAELPIGDVNHDGKVSLEDVQIIRTDIMNGVYDKNADLNGDGKVDAKDIQYFYDVLSLKQ